MYIKLHIDMVACNYIARNIIPHIASGWGWVIFKGGRVGVGELYIILLYYAHARSLPAWIPRNVLNSENVLY